MEGVLETLRENSPTVRLICFSLDDESLSDHELAQALEANEHVRGLIIIDNGMRDCSWDSLLRVIATREILEDIAIGDSVEDDEGSHFVTTRTNKFLQAIRVNPAIRSVHFNNIRVLGVSIASFLDAATFITRFHLLDVRMEAHEQERGAEEIAAALQRNTHIRTLSLGNLNDVYMLPILRGLTTNSHVNELDLTRLGRDGQDLSLAASTGFKSLLESNAKIFKLKFFWCKFKADSFHPIAQGLINSESITNVKFEKCSFKDWGSTLALENILRSKSNVHALMIRHCKSTVHGRTLPATLFTNILRPDAPLESLELCSSMLTDDGFTTLLSLVEKSKVEGLYIGEISGQQKFVALIASIPRMQITGLYFEMSEVDMAHWSSAVVRAIKKNSSLRSVIVDEGGGFNENQRRKLNSYFARNRGLSWWMDAPATIPKIALPKAIVVARDIGPGVVVHILHSLGSSVGPVEGKRSRKRPRFYSPV
jgi:hypothetical protein